MTENLTLTDTSTSQSHHAKVAKYTIRQTRTTPL